jgi:hypothetical protein
MYLNLARNVGRYIPYSASSEAAFRFLASSYANALKYSETHIAEHKICGNSEGTIFLLAC